MPNPRLIWNKGQPVSTRIRNEMEEDDRELPTSLWIENGLKSRYCSVLFLVLDYCTRFPTEAVIRLLSIPQSIVGDVHAEESPVDPTAAIADDSDDEVHVDSVAAEPTVPPPLSLRAMMETFITTQAAHG
nr:hypothetical protein CFP56_48637 [Quercus suber]